MRVPGSYQTEGDLEAFFALGMESEQVGKRESENSNSDRFSLSPFLTFPPALPRQAESRPTRVCGTDEAFVRDNFSASIHSRRALPARDPDTGTFRKSNPSAARYSRSSRIRVPLNDANDEAPARRSTPAAD